MKYNTVNISPHKARKINTTEEDFGKKSKRRVKFLIYILAVRTRKFAIITANCFNYIRMTGSLHRYGIGMHIEEKEEQGGGGGGGGGGGEKNVFFYFFL